MHKRNDNRGKQGKEVESDCGCFSDKVNRNVFSEWVTFQQRPGQSDEVSWGTSQGKGIPGRGNSSMKTLRPSFVTASSVGREERSTFSEHLPSPGDVIV